MDIGVVGGTGPAGSALAARLASVGYDVMIGSRSIDKATEVVRSVTELWPGRKLSLRAETNEIAAKGAVVVLATPWDSATSTAASLAGALAGKVVISMANALTRVGDELQPLTLARGSVAAAVQAVVPQALVAAAFQHVPAKELGALDDPVDCDVLICSDHQRAADATTEIVNRIPGCRALFVGSLSSAAPVEAFTAVLLALNIRHKTRATLRLVGIDTPSTPGAERTG